MKKWKKAFESIDLEPVNSEDYLGNIYKHQRLPNLTLEEMGFVESDQQVPDYNLSKSLLDNYGDTRDKPSIEGTSRLSPYLRFGLVGYREVVQKALQSSDETYLNELIWREFYAMILYHYPESSHKAFKAKYDKIEWRNNEEEFEKWKKGQTGYPIVDAGMRQLNETGWMHNRVRMIVASFLVKDLLIPWQAGAAWFLDTLVDADLANNSASWQWVAGSGTDAAPYFRIFNPTLQGKKFDPHDRYVRRWIP